MWNWCAAACMAVSIGSSTAAGGEDVHHYRDVGAYTRNVYLGADVSILATATDPQGFVVAVQEFLLAVAETNFPLRAKALAAEIESVEPQLIGLQEVADFRLNGDHGPPPFRDYLDDLITELVALGDHYEVAAMVENTSISFAIDVDGDGTTDDLSFVDRDVILARRGIASRPVRFPCRDRSVDGCHYLINLTVPVPQPLPAVTFVRGYVGVDAVVHGRRVRFVNTHLEIEGPIGGQNIATIQVAQALELLSVLSVSAPAKRPIILVGDFNSGPSDAYPAPYALMQIAGFNDTWNLNLLSVLDPNAFTCCQLPDLTNPESLLGERIDLILVRNGGAVSPDVVGPVYGVVVGDRPLPFVQPHWSSDHAGPMVRLSSIPCFEEDEELSQVD